MELKHLKDTINSISIKKQSLEISNLEQDLINKKLKAQILEKELGYDYNAIQVFAFHGNRQHVCLPPP